MTDLIRRVVPGRRYRLHIRPNGECRIPCCDRNYGELLLNELGISQLIITVLRPAARRMVCNAEAQGCGRESDTPEGYWAIGGQIVRRKFTGIVPWTWLEPIEGENYEEGT